MLEWVISSAVLTALVIVLRYILKGKISLRLQYALWALVLLRMLVPVSFGSTSLSVMNAMPDTDYDQSVVTMRLGGTAVINDGDERTEYELPSQQTEYYSARESLEGEGAAVGGHFRQIRLPVTELRRLWLSGVALMALWLFISNLRFAARLRRSRRVLHVEGCALPVYLSPEVDTPCLFGLLRPSIYLTPEAADSETVLRHSVEHETTHFRHGDHIWAILRGACLAIHWYNPLVWWAAMLSRNDAELACDEATIKRIGENQRAEYGRTLIEMTCQKRPALLLTATTMTGSKSSIKERIMLIAKKPKMAVYTLIAVMLITALAVGCTFTGAEKTEVVPVFTGLEEVKSIALKSVPTGPEDTLTVREEYFDEMLEWVSAFTLGKEQKETDTPEPGTNSYSVILTYADSSTVSSGIDITELDGIPYYIVRPDLPACWHELWEGDGQASNLIESADKAWSETDAERWQAEVPLIGFSARAAGGNEEIGQQWAEAYVAQYVDSAAPDSPLYSADAAVLNCTLTAESLLSTPKTLIYNMRFVCDAADPAAFERWYVGWAGPLSEANYPQYEGWMEFGWYVVLENTGDGEWRCADAGTGGYGGWGYLNFDRDGEFEACMAELLAGRGDDSAEALMCCLPLVDWSKFDVEGWNALYVLLDAHCLTEGQVYGPEETRLWSDVYPDDQAYRNLYVMYAALNSDGAYSEGLTVILKKQQSFDSELFELCLKNLTPTQRDTIEKLLAA